MSRTAHPPPVTDRDLPLLLAVYGTLRRGCRNHHVLAGSVLVAEGAVTGVLHEILAPVRLDYGYPLLVVPPVAGPGSPTVVVEVYRVEDPAVLDALDALEAYDPDDPDGSEYVRVRVPLLARGTAGPASAVDSGPPAGPSLVQVYAYAGEADEQGPVLPGGDWFTHAGALG